MGKVRIGNNVVNKAIFISKSGQKIAEGESVSEVLNKSYGKDTKIRGRESSEESKE